MYIGYWTLNKYYYYYVITGQERTQLEATEEHETAV